MKLGYASRLLLDFGKGCTYHGIQATGRTRGEKNAHTHTHTHTHDFVCVK